MREESKSAPIAIRPVFKSPGMTVTVKVLGQKALEFGYSAPGPDQQFEVAEIRRILAAHGIRTELVPIEH